MKISGTKQLTFDPSNTAHSRAHVYDILTVNIEHEPLRMASRGLQASLKTPVTQTLRLHAIRPVCGQKLVSCRSVAELLSKVAKESQQSYRAVADQFQSLIVLRHSEKTRCDLFSRSVIGD